MKFEYIKSKTILFLATSLVGLFFSESAFGLKAGCRIDESVLKKLVHKEKKHWDLSDVKMFESLLDPLKLRVSDEKRTFFDQEPSCWMRYGQFIWMDLLSAITVKELKVPKKGLLRVLNKQVLSPMEDTKSHIEYLMDINILNLAIMAGLLSVSEKGMQDLQNLMSNKSFVNLDSDLGSFNILNGNLPVRNNLKELLKLKKTMESSFAEMSTQFDEMGKQTRREFLKWRKAYLD